MKTQMFREFFYPLCGGTDKEQRQDVRFFIK